MPAAAALYEIAAAHGGRCELAAVAEESGLDAHRVAAGWRTLADLALVRVADGRVETLGSDDALDAVVGRYASYAFETLRSVRAVNDATRKLLAVFGSGAPGPGGAPPAVLPFPGALYDLGPGTRERSGGTGLRLAEHDAPPPRAPRPPGQHPEHPASAGCLETGPAADPGTGPEPHPRTGTGTGTGPESEPHVEPHIEPYSGPHGRERALRAVAESTAVSLDCLHKGTLPPDPAVLDAYLDLIARLVRRGVHVRALCTPVMLRAPGGTRYTRRVVAAGAHVRVVDRVGHDVLISDGRTVCVPDTSCAEPGDPAMLHVTSPRLARTFLVAYEAYWRRAVPYTPLPAWRTRAEPHLPAAADRTAGHAADRAGDAVAPDAVTTEPPLGAPQLGAFEQAVVRLMAAGRSDAAIARELGVGTGAVADVMTSLMRQLGAANRFEAGIRLARALGGAHLT